MENIRHLKYVSNSKEVGHPLDPEVKASLISVLIDFPSFKTLDCLNCPSDIVLKCSDLFKGGEQK